MIGDGLLVYRERRTPISGNIHARTAIVIASQAHWPRVRGRRPNK
jgi:hypothetical protein